MYKINDNILYKREVCIIKEIKNNYVNNKDYYIISPVTDKTLIIKIPIDSPYIKELPEKEEIITLINSITEIEIIDSSEKNLENVYKELLSTEDLKDLIKIIKTCYIRNQKRLENGKKIGDKDDSYLKRAEKLLYTTLSIPLKMSYEECQKYIIKTINEKENQ